MDRQYSANTQAAINLSLASEPAAAGVAPNAPLPDRRAIDRQYSANTLAAINLSLSGQQSLPLLSIAAGSADSLPLASLQSQSQESLPPMDLAAGLDCLPTLPSSVSSSSEISSASPSASPSASSPGSSKKRQRDNDEEDRSTDRRESKRFTLAPQGVTWPAVSAKSSSERGAESTTTAPAARAEAVGDTARLMARHGQFENSSILEWTKDGHQWIKACHFADPLLQCYRTQKERGDSDGDSGGGGDRSGVKAASRRLPRAALERMHSSRTQAAVDLSLALAGRNVAAKLEGTWTDWKGSDGKVPEQPEFVMIVCRRDDQDDELVVGEPPPQQLLFDVFKVTLASDAGECERLILKTLEDSGSVQIVKASDDDDGAAAAAAAAAAADGTAGGEQQQRGGEGGLARSQSKALRTKFLERRRELHRPELRPPGRQINVPGTGACLFHAISQSQRQDVAHALRLDVVRWVRAHWESNPDISSLLGPARRAVQWNPAEEKYEPMLLQEQLDEHSSLAEYVAHMSAAGTYATSLEAAIAATVKGWVINIWTEDGYGNQLGLGGAWPPPGGGAGGGGGDGGCLPSCTRDIVLLNGNSPLLCHYNFLIRSSSGS
jgi:hypothetical protein